MASIIGQSGIHLELSAAHGEVTRGELVVLGDPDVDQVQPRPVAVEGDGYGRCTGRELKGGRSQIGVPALSGNGRADLAEARVAEQHGAAGRSRVKGRDLLRD